MQFSDFLSLALVVKRIETGKAVPMVDQVTTMDEMARALLLGDPALIQKVLRLIVTCSPRVIAGLISAAAHEAEESCEDCAKKFELAGDSLRNLLQPETSEEYITAIVAQARKVLDEADGDVAKAIQNIREDIKELEKGPEERDPTELPRSKKKEYLN